MALLLPGCTSDTPADSESSGPLSGPISSGLSGIFTPPGRERWSATFGTQLCVEGSDEVVITGLAYDVTTDPVELDTWIRRVPARAQQTGEGNWLAMGSRIGGKDGILGPGSRVRGEIETDAVGQRIDLGCEVTDGSFVELLTVMQVDRRGGQVDELRIDYDAGGAAYDLEVAWTYVACGTDVDAQDSCRGAPPSATG